MILQFQGVTAHDLKLRLVFTRAVLCAGPGFRLSPHHVAQHRPAGSETTPPYTPRSSRFGSQPPSVEDDVDVWPHGILELYARNDNMVRVTTRVPIHLWVEEIKMSVSV